MFGFGRATKQFSLSPSTSPSTSPPPRPPHSPKASPGQKPDEPKARVFRKSKSVLASEHRMQVKLDAEELHAGTELHVNETKIKLQEQIEPLVNAHSQVVTAKVMQHQTRGYMDHHSEYQEHIQKEYKVQQDFNRVMVEELRTAQADFPKMDDLEAVLEKRHTQLQSELEQENTRLRGNLAAVKEVVPKVEEKMMDEFSTFRQKLDTRATCVKKEEEVRVNIQVDSFHKISIEHFALITKLESQAEEVRDVQAQLTTAKAALQDYEEAVKRLKDIVAKSEARFQEYQETHTQELQAARERFEAEQKLKLEAEASLGKAMEKQYQMEADLASLMAEVSRKDSEVEYYKGRSDRSEQRLKDSKTEMEAEWTTLAEKHTQSVKEEVFISRTEEHDEKTQELLKMQDEHHAELKKIVADFRKSCEEDISSPSPSHDWETERILVSLRNEIDTLHAKLDSRKATETGVQNIIQVYDDRKTELEESFKELMQERSVHEQTVIQLKQIEHERDLYRGLFEQFKSVCHQHQSCEESWSRGVQQATYAKTCHTLQRSFTMVRESALMETKVDETQVTLKRDQNPGSQSQSDPEEE